MANLKANGISIEYEEFGPRNGSVVLLIMGLGAQLTRWPSEFIAHLTERGYRVIRYDNRDVGLSQKFESAGVPQIAQIMADAAQGKKINAVYSLDDMADDAAGLLTALGIARAHIVGASMGGMIAQLVAAHHADKTISLTSIMSSTGNPELPPAMPEAMAVLMTRPPANDLQAIIDSGVKASRVIGSPAYPADEKTLRANIERDIKRSNYPAGFARQMAAVFDSVLSCRVYLWVDSVVRRRGATPSRLQLSAHVNRAAYLPGFLVLLLNTFGLFGLWEAGVFAAAMTFMLAITGADYIRGLNVLFSEDPGSA